MPLDAAVRDGKIPSNPAIGITLPRITRRLQTPHDVLTGEELSRLVDALPERYRALVFVNGWLGLRWSEGLGLRRRDWNPLRSQLYVGTVVVVEVGGKNIVREGGKTDAASRLLPVPQAVAAKLNEHIEHFAVGPDGFLFTRDRKSVV